MTAALKWVVRPQTSGVSGTSTGIRMVVAHAVLAQRRQRAGEKPRYEPEERKDDLQRVYACHILIQWRLQLKTFFDNANALWTAREAGAQSDISLRICSACVLYASLIKFYDRVKADYDQIVDNGTASLPYVHRNALANYMHAVLHKALPKLLSEVKRFVQFYVQEVAVDRLRHIFMNYRRPFMEQPTSIYTVLGWLALCLPGGDTDGNSTFTRTSACAERDIETALREHCVRVVYRSCQAAVPGSRTLCARICGLAVSAALRTLLIYVLSNNEAFDEMGVYKLYRILLRLQELVSDLKVDLNMQPSERIVEDTLDWQKAGAVLRVLNNAVFAGSIGATVSPEKAVATAVAGRNGVDMGSVPTSRPPESVEGVNADNVQHSAPDKTSTALTSTEQALWEALVHPPGRTLFPRRSRRRKGTVFAALELNLAAL